MRAALLWITVAVATSSLAAPAAGQNDEIIERAEDLIGRAVGGAILVTGQEDGDGEAASGEPQGGVALPEDAALRRRLAQAARLAENGRPEDAAQALGRLAESVGDADAFVRIDERTLRSVKAEVQRMIGDSSPEIMAAYELSFGPAARRMLDETGSDPAMIRRVATLYPRTKAGADALYRFAEVCRDCGSFVEAAACLDRLRAMHPEVAAAYEPNLSLRLAACRLRAGDRTGAEAAIADLARRAPAAVLAVGGGPAVSAAAASSEALFASIAGPSAPARPVPFTPHPGDADAPRAAAAEPFLVPRWSAATAGADAAGERGGTPGRPVPAIFPAAAGELVLVPAASGFVAYGLATGARLWSYPAQGSNTASVGGVRADLARARLSTDGRAVFLVENDRQAGGVPTPTGPAAAQIAQLQMGFFPGQGAFMMPNAVGSVSAEGSAGPTTNVLTALDVTPPRQANLLWRVGGATGTDEPLLAGHLFLGPPLATHGRLYAVAEQDRTVRLVVLDSETGRLEWRLDLGQAEVPLTADPERRRIGATPTLVRGTLLFPTAGGSVVAVDLAGRSLLWGFRYPRDSPPAAVAEFEVSATPPTHGSGWADATIRVAGDRVFMTPPEASAAYCLELPTGRLVWQRPRGEDLFLASADGDRALFIGPAGATLVNASDGSTLGEAEPFPAGAAPTGRGYEAEGFYVQPLSDGSLLRTELATGSTAPVGRVSRGFTLGNLTWHDGTLLSLGADAVRAFDGRVRLEAAVAARLAAAPDDPAALLRRADLHAEAGRFADAIADCRRAYAADRSPTVRSRLVAALLDGVRNGLPGAAAYDAELDRLAGLK